MKETYRVKDLNLIAKEKGPNKFIKKKDNAIKSLKEVEYFLCNWKKVVKGIKLYKILK